MVSSPLPFLQALLCVSISCLQSSYSNSMQDKQQQRYKQGAGPLRSCITLLFVLFSLLLLAAILTTAGGHAWKVLEEPEGRDKGWRP